MTGLALRWVISPIRRRLLGTRRERPRGRRAAKHCDELAPPHTTPRG